MANRIIHTQKGLDMKRIFQEDARIAAASNSTSSQASRKNSNMILNHHDQSSFFRSPDSYRQQYPSQDISRNETKIPTSPRSYNKAGVYLLTDSDASTRLLDLYTQETNKSKDSLSPFLLKQFNRFPTDLSRVQSLPTLQNSQDRQSPFLIQEQQQQSVMLSCQNGTSGLSADEFKAVMHCDARIDRILSRYKKYKDITGKIDQRIEGVYLARRSTRDSMPPVNLESKGTVAAAGGVAQVGKGIVTSTGLHTLEELGPNDDYEVKRKHRVHQLMNKKYKQFWNNLHVPTQFKKSQSIQPPQLLPQIHV